MRKRLILIQFSRALVPILVMLFHIAENMKDYWNYNLLGFSYLPVSGGVNYFFALSGFMLYYVYQKKLFQPAQIKGFLLNRLIRIYPLYWILTFIAIIAIFLYPAVGIGNDFKSNNILYSLLLFPNPNDQEPVLDVAWSLVHTIYFYLIFTVLFGFKHKLANFILFAWAGISFLSFTEIMSVDNVLYDFFFDQYNLIFLAGILVAYCITRIQFSFRFSVILAVIGFIGFPLTWLNYIYKIINVDFDISTGLASVLIIFGLASIDMQKSIKIPALFNYLGNASFAIYLAHNIVLNAFSELFNQLSVFKHLGGAVTSMLLLILITIVGCYVHSLIEKPIISKLKRGIFKKPGVEKKITTLEIPSKTRIT